ncbi:MAG: GNAT family N-acetyltransferase [Marinobacterium sp.]|nr:GNAT family N-acetyltransferase [Marinobacterium sp.]
MNRKHRHSPEKALRPEKVQLRHWQPQDSTAICSLFHAAINQIACQHYSPEQRYQWAHPSLDEYFWQQRLAETHPIVATVAGQVVGFIEFIETDAWIDCLYVHPDYAGQGVGQLLLQQVLNMALTTRLARLQVDVSHTAMPLFSKMGFIALHENHHKRNGVTLTNTRMEKRLLPI